MGKNTVTGTWWRTAGFIAAAVSLKTEEPEIRQNNLQNQWLEEHTEKMRRLAETLNEIGQRFENLGERIDRTNGVKSLGAVAQIILAPYSAMREK